MTKLYTAVGRFEKRSEGSGKTYPVILVNREEIQVDIQEMMIWTVLNWRILLAEFVVKPLAPRVRRAFSTGRSRPGSGGR